MGQPSRTGVLIKKGHLDPHRGESPENASSDQGDVYVPATARRSPGAGGRGGPDANPAHSGALPRVGTPA